MAKNGYIVLRKTNLSGGTIDVKDNASLTVAGIIAKRNSSSQAVTADDGLTYANATTGTCTQGGAFNLTGGAINVGVGASASQSAGVTVSDNAVVILGDNEKANKGKLGDVTLGSSGAATLNAVGASGAAFEARKITKGSVRQP